MDKETIDKKLKCELELLKVYLVLVLAVGTGVLGLFLKQSFLENKSERILFIAGGIFFVIFVIAFIVSWLKINRLNEKL